ncbi:hypothetical protein CLF_111292 [Clonorchis sinensis]|uniref:Uncharacterized protein n=1 Tax=Clonorchis sinensis TaxID=79923 RepID=G7YLL4_CLOSI|nr:hypothetical protein CLF_111292 [Clonorchis sinensis]
MGVQNSYKLSRDVVGKPLVREMDEFRDSLNYMVNPAEEKQMHSIRNLCEITASNGDKGDRGDGFHGHLVHNQHRLVVCYGTIIIISCKNHCTCRTVVVAATVSSADGLGSNMISSIVITSVKNSKKFSCTLIRIHEVNSSSCKVSSEIRDHTCQAAIDLKSSQPCSIIYVFADVSSRFEETSSLRNAGISYRSMHRSCQYPNTLPTISGASRS